MADIPGLLAMTGPANLIAAVAVIGAFGIVMYAYLQRGTIWIASGFAASTAAVVLRPVNDMIQADLSTPILFLGGVVAAGGFFLSAYRSWQEIRETHEAEEVGRVVLE